MERCANDVPGTEEGREREHQLDGATKLVLWVREEIWQPNAARKEKVHAALPRLSGYRCILCA
jgi:hypothetical protein